MGIYAAGFQGIEDDSLPLGRSDNLTTSTHKILVAAEVQDEHVHELGILLREHTRLEVGESLGKSYGSGIGIMGTAVLHGA